MGDYDVGYLMEGKLYSLNLIILQGGYYILLVQANRGNGLLGHTTFV
uniref:Uncharacterized protein n=1 Tax=Ciona intestinalis TaxID=7719 RepID=H2XJZ2_CIOIN